MFIPGSRNPENLDLAMRQSLADSLSYIYSEAKAGLKLTDSQVASALDEIRAHRIKPGIFGRYYKLVLAMRTGDISGAEKLFSSIVEQSKHRASFRVLPYNEASLGDDKDIYAALLDPKPEGVPLFVSPQNEDWSRFSKDTSAALDIIRTSDAELADELRSLTTEIVAIAPSTVRSFGGASSFMLWGALTMSVSRFDTAWKLVEGLVHEGAHQLLFAHSIDEPLVTNPIEERYSSPLRPDPRPMDGVFHATFVTARVHYALDKVRATISPTFAPIDRTTLDDRLKVLKRLFAGGLETIRTHGKLTPTGQQIIEESTDYMKAA